MAASSAVVANKALGHLGVVGGITTLSSDTTLGGTACRTFYDGAVAETLKGAPWRSAMKIAALTLVEALEATRDEEWTYSYRLPEDCLAVRRIRLFGNRDPNADQEVPFDEFADTASTTWSASTAYAVGDYAQVAATLVWYRCILAHTNQTPPNGTYWVAITGGPPKLLHCHVSDAVIEYTYALTDPTRWDEDLEAAIAARLAFDIATMVTVNGSAVDLRRDVAGTYNALVSKAIENDQAARKRGPPARSTYETARHRPGRG